MWKWGKENWEPGNSKVSDSSANEHWCSWRIKKKSEKLGRKLLTFHWEILKFEVDLDEKERRGVTYLSIITVPK